MKQLLAAAFAVFALRAIAPTHAAEPADLALVLAADVSRSINQEEFELQRRGYAAALTDPRVVKAIRSGPLGVIAICYLEWASDNEQMVIANWTVVRDDESAGVIAGTILAAPRSFFGRTAIGTAIDFAMDQFGRATVEATRRIIDVSGDGTSNAGRPVTAARDDALAKGVTINGLAIINNNPTFFYPAHTHPPGGLPQYYRENVIGGPGTFLKVIEDFDSFKEAMVSKLVTEIAGRDPAHQQAERPSRDAERTSVQVSGR